MFSSSLPYLVALLASTAVADVGSESLSAQRPLLLGLEPSEEVPEPVGLNIIGHIPHWLMGSLYRGAQGAWDAGNYSAEHWFDGFSRNHRFEISNGRVEYRNRNGSDELQDFVREHGLYPGGSFGGDPCKIIFGAFELTFRDGVNPAGNSSATAVDVAYISDFPGLDRNTTNYSTLKSLVSATDGNALQQLDPISMEPIELFTYQANNPLLTDGGRSASHGQRGSRGEVYNYVLDLDLSPPSYRVFEIQTNGTATILATITDAPPAYLHTIFSTENYLILIVWQADIGKTAKPTYNLLDSLQPWDPERETLFYVIDKQKGGVVAKYTSEAFFAFHSVNSFEDPETNSIIIDIPTAKDYSFLEAARIPNMRANLFRPNSSSYNDIPFVFHRFRLPNYKSAQKDVNGTILPMKAILDFTIPYEEGNIELPRINEKHYNKPYRYAYGVHIIKTGYFADSIVKIDTKTKKTSYWHPETEHVPSEPIFVSHPQPTSEDDGVLLVVALSAKRRLSSMVVIDAKSMKEIGRAELPVVVGYGFHGIFA